MKKKKARRYTSKKKKIQEYSKRMLSFIVINSVGMMWMSYVLAFCDKPEIAEALSKTIASAIIAVVIVYFAKSTLENISKHTTAFGDNVPPYQDDNDEAL